MSEPFDLLVRGATLVTPSGLLRADIAASVAIGALRRVDHERRIADNVVDWLVYPLEQVADRQAHIWHAIKRRIDRAIADRLWIYVGKS